MKKAVLALLTLILCLGLCGCTTLSFKSLMSPPKANNDQQAIFNLLKDENGNVNYFYPKSGEYRSAVIMHDFNGDGKDDAIGFCTGDDSGGIDIKFMSNGSGLWSVVDSFGNTASQVDRVAFGDVTGDGVDDIIVGWGSPQSLTASISVYSAGGDRIDEYSVDSLYSEFILTDFDLDGVMEIFIAGIQTQSDDSASPATEAAAKLYRYDGSRITLSCTAPLNANVTRYAGVTFTKMPGGITGVILDGALADNSLITQAVTCNSDLSALSVPTSDEKAVADFNYFSRPASLPVNSMDIGGDGYYEVPLVSLTAGYSAANSNPSTCFLVDWVRFAPDGGSVVSIMPTIMNIPDKYYVVLPQSYKKNIITSNNSTLREVIFYKAELTEDNLLQSAVKLFSIRTFTRSEWAEITDESYTLLATGQGDLVYAVHIDEENTFSQSIIDSFTIISD